MRILFFSLIFWLSILAIAAADSTFFKVCRIPRIKHIRRKRYIKLEEFQEYDTCKREEIQNLNKKHDQEVSRKEAEIETLKEQLWNGNNYADTSEIDYPEYTSDSSKCDGVKAFKDPKTL